jgi:N-acetylglucosamine-6-phosphate deacetylase
MTSIITARRLLRGNEFIEYPRITVEDGHITSIHSRHESEAGDAYPEATLVPAYVNIHVHGAVGHDVMEGTPDALQAAAQRLPDTGWEDITRLPSPHPPKKRCVPWT